MACTDLCGHVVTVIIACSNYDIHTLAAITHRAIPCSKTSMYMGAASVAAVLSFSCSIGYLE